MSNFKYSNFSLKSKLILAVIFVAFYTSSAFAVDYPLGSEGIKGPSFPGHGFYYVLYNQFYSADKLKDENGDEQNVGFKVNSYAMAHRFVYVTNKKIMGADYGFNVIIPVVKANLDIDAAGVDSDKSAVGDITIEPLVIAWHKPQQDITLSMSVLVPTGEYDKNAPLSIGGDHYNVTATAGTTIYLDPARLWNVAVLSRYEKHFENQDTDLTYGDDFFFEWGAGRTVGLFDLGLSGYAHWQVTKDKGSDRTSDNLDRVYAAGPEVQMAIPALKAQVRAKYLKEFGAKDTKEGNAFWLTLVKAF